MGVIGLQRGGVVREGGGDVKDGKAGGLMCVLFTMLCFGGGTE